MGPCRLCKRPSDTSKVDAWHLLHCIYHPTSMCRCQAGWQGTSCDVPSGCSGQLDSDGTCCSGFVDRSVSEQHSRAVVQAGGCTCSQGRRQLTCASTCYRQGNCCPGVSKPDADGQCCTGGHLDACGECNGNATVVDLAGGHLPAVVHSVLSAATPAYLSTPLLVAGIAPAVMQPQLTAKHQQLVRGCPAYAWPSATCSCNETHQHL